MTRLVISSRAHRDMDELTIYLAEHAGWSTAAKYVDLLDALYEAIKVHPLSGAPRPRVGRSIRIGIVSPYIAVYRYDESADLVTVARVLHGHRRLTKRLVNKAR